MRLCWNGLDELEIYDHDVREKMEMLQQGRDEQVEGEKDEWGSAQTIPQKCREFSFHGVFKNNE